MPPEAFWIGLAATVVLCGLLFLAQGLARASKRRRFVEDMTAKAEFIAQRHERAARIEHLSRRPGCAGLSRMLEHLVADDDPVIDARVDRLLDEYGTPRFRTPADIP